MEILQGTCASDGVALGNIKIIDGENFEIKRYNIENVSAEIERFKKAVEKTKEQLSLLYDKTLTSASEEEAEIFQIHPLL